MPRPSASPHVRRRWPVAALPFAWLALGAQTAPPTAPPAPPTAPPAASQVAPEPAPAFRERVGEIIAILNGEGDYAATFAPRFRTAVPPAEFTRIATQLRDALGRAMGVQSVRAANAYAAQLRMAFERGILNVDVVVDPAPPHQVTGLLARGTETQEADMNAIVRTVAALPGTAGFAFARLGPDGPSTIAGHASAKPLAIGSAFKLVIFAELVRAINAGERRWTDEVVLDGMPLPGGAYTFRPKGVRVPISELAERMISVSDNSATDILLFHLGRERVEAMLPVVGMTDGGTRNRPFLGTLEAFKLKGVDGGALGTRYLAADIAGRRALLAGAVAAAPISTIPATLFQDGVPIRIDTLEWFASPDDLVRTLDWLCRNTEGAGGTQARAILSKNPGVGNAAARWQWIGYKGGSEPGVLNQSFLLRGRNGEWYAVAGTWNDPARAVDELKFLGLMSRAVELAAPAAAANAT